MQNPLEKYKKQNPCEWKDISATTGIPVQTLMSILKKDEKTIGGVTLATAIRLEQTIGIKLSEYYKIN